MTSPPFGSWSAAGQKRRPETGSDALRNDADRVDLMNDIKLNRLIAEKTLGCDAQAVSH